MKKVTIGIVLKSEKVTLEEKYFINTAKKLNINLIIFNIAKDLDEIEMVNRAKKCQIIYNDTDDPLSIEFAKTLEEMGIRVVEPSRTSYYIEDKWLMYLKFKKNKIPLPDTILLSTDITDLKKELNDFGHWPVILKRIYGCRGEFVEKANNVDEAVKIIKRIWGKGVERFPIIAQQFILSDSYRITMIGGKIVQTAIKKRGRWKATGCKDSKFRKFKVDKNLREMCQKISKLSKIEILGIDFAKYEGKWVLIEVNAEPSFKMYTTEHKRLIEKVLIYLRKLALKHPQKN